MTFTATTVPILGMYNSGGAFPTPGPSAWNSGPTTNMTGAYFAFPEADYADYIGPFISQCKANSLTPFVELEPWNFDQTPIPFSDITGGTYDSQLTAIGTGIAAAAVPVMLTFAHEFNVSGQYPWAQNAVATLPSGVGSGPGGGNLTAAEWIAGWEHVVTKIRSTANGYALFMWGCSAYTGGTTISPASYWPGSSYVDMVGIDGYPDTEYGESLGTFAGQIQPTVTIIRGLGWSNPIFISETNLAAMVSSGGESITGFVANMYTAGISGIFEFEESYEPDMTSTQWTEYNDAITANYGGGGGGGGPYSYTQTIIDNFTQGGSTLNPSIWITPDYTNGITVSGGSLIIEGISNFEQVAVVKSLDYNLADGIFGLQLSQAGTEADGTMWFLGIADDNDPLGNYYEFQTFPIDASWYPWAGTGAAVSNQIGNQNILSPSVWTNGNWLALGNYNLNGNNDVHVYQSPNMTTWTEIASWQVTGAINESAVCFYFGTNYNPGTGTSNYVATIDNVSWFTRGAAAVSSGLLMIGIA